MQSISQVKQDNFTKHTFYVISEFYSNMIQHDMQELKEEWIDSVDMIYSNSYDHCYDPQKCMTNWVKCLTKTGLIFLHVGEYHFEDKRKDPTPGDCFTATQSEYINIIDNANGNIVKQIETLPGR